MRSNTRGKRKRVGRELDELWIVTRTPADTIRRPKRKEKRRKETVDGSFNIALFALFPGLEKEMKEKL